MQDEKKPRSKTSYIIGAVLVLVALISVIFIKLQPKPVEEVELVRPVKTYAIGEMEMVSSWKYTGDVRPNEEVQMSFEVDGTVTELKVNRGQAVKKGQLLAKLDPRDFQNNIDAAKARKNRSVAYLERMTKAIAMNAVSQQEFDDANAQYEVSASELRIAEKALEDSSIYARFDGTVADTYIDQYENVRAKQPVLTLHDVTTVEIVADIAEKRIFTGKGDTNNLRHTAVFDYLSDKEFDLKFKEISTEADPDTQTYRVTFTMPQPDEIQLYAGMSASVLEYNLAEKNTKHSGYMIPLSAAVIDSDGSYFVWRLDDAGDGTALIKRVSIKVGMLAEDRVVTLSGIEQGDLIASGGVHFLRDGQRVRILK